MFTEVKKLKNTKRKNICDPEPNVRQVDMKKDQSSLENIGVDCTLKKIKKDKKRKRSKQAGNLASEINEKKVEEKKSKHERNLDPETNENGFASKKLKKKTKTQPKIVKKSSANFTNKVVKIANKCHETNTSNTDVETNFEKKSIEEQTEILNKENFGQLEKLDFKKEKETQEKFSNQVKSDTCFNENHPALVYLNLWKHDKKNWSFKKIQQVWLLKHLYNDSVIPDKYFLILLEYMKNAKGNAKLQTLTEAEKFCAENLNNDNESAKIKLTRAHNVIQYLS